MRARPTTMPTQSFSTPPPPSSLMPLHYTQERGNSLFPSSQPRRSNKVGKARITSTGSEKVQRSWEHRTCKLKRGHCQPLSAIWNLLWSKSQEGCLKLTTSDLPSTVPTKVITELIIWRSRSVFVILISCLDNYICTESDGLFPFKSLEEIYLIFLFPWGPNVYL